MATNPPWARDELILALDLYFDHPPSKTSKTHVAVLELSETLNALPLHSDRPDAARFRNPNGVYMKLGNFLRFDRTYKGKGLQRGAKAEEEVWATFASDRALLKRTADAIRAGAPTPEAAPRTEAAAASDEDEFPEGKVLYRLHCARERSRELRDRAKSAAMKREDCLRCTVCGFDFAKKYGSVGDGFIECHHAVPVSELRPGSTTKVRDLVLLCANCHRMVHRRRPWLGPADLAHLLAKSAKTQPAPRTWWEEVHAEIRALEEPEGLFNGSRDFLLAWELLQAHRRTPEVQQSRAPFPIQADATCASMALELALKSRLRLHGLEPPRTHDFARLFRCLPEKVQTEIAASTVLDGKPTDRDGLAQALERCKNTFEIWRYLHEHDNADFYEPWIIATTASVHEVILRLRPEWQPWPGVLTEAVAP